ncbi:cupin domain-containing protein [Pleomorphomonas sp. NRK KF1]|uniref:cupin domain-containing protein n=1 Tax=Pleomorphomonas sp. NRK KF1 TaxID=2943000 RepID=UPI002044388B|nr:cupin domain-containing protein [Pleomorphomonas sp. NRK KF1]MCM5553648.1 cupin domain-containing protein [Pleomorphomonas sp. NRK KF1]
MPRILNLTETAFDPEDDLDRTAPKGYAARFAAIGKRLGARMLGYSLIEVAPGCRASPLHNHRCNEEMFLILDGEGTVRIGSERHSIRAGDIIACPPGGPESAHQIENTSGAVLIYLAVSTMVEPDVIDYPDSGKFLVKGRLPAGDDAHSEPFRFIGRHGTGLGYWDDEG